MLLLLSPAKTLDITAPFPNLPTSPPRLLSDSQLLIDVCRQLSIPQLQSLMKISQPLAELNHQRFSDWSEHAHQEISATARPALWLFKGEVYHGLDVATLDLPAIWFAQQHLRILSGLYGLLCPLDIIQPHRLEMGTRLDNRQGKDLYHFWNNKITELIQHDLTAQQDDLVINLASDEYYRAVNEKNLSAEIIKPVFLDHKNGQYKVISFYAKHARGLMARFIIENQLNDKNDIRKFDTQGYYFDATCSTDTEWIFKRDKIAE